MTTTPTGTALAGPAHDYRAAVERSLLDLPVTDREEILAEVSEHLAEVWSELGEAADEAALLARLGPPEAYASELRSAAGYTARSRSAVSIQRGVGDLRSAADRMLAWVEAREWGPPTLVYLRQLRPAWWLVRGWVLLLALGGFDRHSLVLPATVNNPLVDLVLLVAAIAASVWLGVRGAGHVRDGGGRARRLARLGVGLNVLAVLLLPQAVHIEETVVMVDASGPPDAAFAESNLYAFGADGEPIGTFYLYDEYGTPVQGVEDLGECDGQDGQPVLPQQFPKPQVRWEEVTVDGVTEVRCTVVSTAPPFAIVLPPDAVSTSPSPSPAPSPSLAPSPSPSVVGSPTPSQSPSGVVSPSPSATPGQSPGAGKK